MTPLDDHQVPSTSNGSHSAYFRLTPPNILHHQNSPLRMANAGPVQKFRENNGIRNRNYLENWIADNPAAYIHGYQPMHAPVPRAESVMSSIPGSVATGLSDGMTAMSVQMSTLSVNTQMTNFAFFPQQTTPSNNENLQLVNPDMNLAITEAVRALQSREPKQMRKAACTLNQMTKMMDTLAKVNHQTVKFLFKVIFEVIEVNVDHDVTLYLLLFIATVHNIFGQPIEELMQEQHGKPFITILTRIEPDKPYSQKAITAASLLRNLKRLRLVNAEWAIHRLMSFAFHKDLNYKAQSMAIGLTQHFLFTTTRKEIFLRKVGFHNLLLLLDPETNDEQVIAATIKICLTLIISTSKHYAQAFVLCGGIERCTALLGHGSPRILLYTLRCLTCIGDLTEVKQRDIRETIVSVLRQIGSNDPRIPLYASQFLLNVSGFSPNHKKFIVESRGPHDIMGALAMLNVYAQFPVENNKRIVEEMVMDACTCLCNLTLGEAETDEWLKQSIEQIYNYDIWFFLNTLARFNDVVLRCKVLTIIERVAKLRVNNIDYISKFVNRKDDQFGLTLGGILLQLALNLLDKYRNSLGTSQMNPKEIELLKRSLKLLRLLAINNETAADVINILYSRMLNPLSYVLEQNDETTVTIKCLVMRWVNLLTNHRGREKILPVWLTEAVYDYVRFISHLPALNDTTKMMTQEAHEIISRFHRLQDPKPEAMES